MRATWYVLEDGTPVDPNEVSTDKNGALVHKNGKVAVGDHGNYRSTGVDLGDAGKPLFGGKGDHDANGSTGGAKSKDIKPEEPTADKKTGYKTRDQKAK